MAFISTDTYRIAAIEQLKTFAHIAGIPIEVTYSVDEIKRAIYQHRDKDVILLDTPGRSPNNSAHLREIREMLDRESRSDIRTS